MRKCIVLLLFAAIPVFATEPNPTPKQRDLIEKILAATNSSATMHTALDAMLAQAQNSFKGDGEDATDGREMSKMFRERAAKLDLAKEVQEEMIRIYAKYFTDVELTDLLNFYTSPTGKKLIAEMPSVLRESMQLGAEKIGPRLMQLSDEVQQDYEKTRPWHNTMKDLRSIAVAVEAYATDNDGNFPAGDIDAIKKVLAPTYIKDFPEHDMWGHAYAYVVSDDHKHYRIVSAGADTNFEWDSLRITPVPADFQTRWSNRLEDDLIYADGQYYQMPLQAMPKSDS